MRVVPCVRVEETPADRVRRGPGEGARCQDRYVVGGCGDMDYHLVVCHRDLYIVSND